MQRAGQSVSIGIEKKIELAVQQKSLLCMG
jgi:hypothetical protein